MSAQPQTEAPLTTVELWPHQRQAIARAMMARGFMVAMGMGSGKSRVAVEVAERSNATKVLILCPRSVVDVWPTQFATHSFRVWSVWAGECYGPRGLRANPSTVQKAVALAQVLGYAYSAMPVAAVVNYEAAIQPTLADMLLGVEWDLVILDESHRLKKPGGKASLLAFRIAKRVRANHGRALALTGTPMPHSPLDLYAQYRALDETVLGTSYSAFRQHYGQPLVKFVRTDGTPVYMTVPGTNQPIYAGVRSDRQAELTTRIAPLMFQVDADELDRTLGLLEPVDQHRTVTLAAPTWRVYRDLERHLIAEIDGGVCTASNAMVKVLRLAQAVNGFAVDADTHQARQIMAPHPEKSVVLADVLEDLDIHEPVVVFCRFHHDLDEVKRIAESQGREYGELSGRNRDGMTDRATMHPRVDVLGAQLKAGGLGVDLTRARHAIYFSLDFSLADYLQTRKRLHRPGQAHRVVYTHLIAAGTVDESIYGALRRREEVVTTVLADLKRAAG